MIGEVDIHVTYCLNGLIDPKILHYYKFLNCLNFVAISSQIFAFLFYMVLNICALA